MDSLLSRSFKLGSVTVRNRLVMGAMHTGLEQRPDGLVRLTEFYRQRAEGEIGLIFTGGYSPSRTGMTRGETSFDTVGHQKLTQTVHRFGAKICLQILHAGRYSVDANAVSPSAIRAPISPIRPRALAEDEIFDLIRDYGVLAARAMDAGYDGVEINGAEGFLISQFLAPRTNSRTDQWGGSFDNRSRFASLVTQEVRRRIGESGLLSFRISLIDLVEQGSTWSETLQLARQLETDGVTAFNTAIGWNESRVPTTSGAVPRGAFAVVAKKFRASVQRPVIAGGRINTLESAESMISSESCDLVSISRAVLADPAFAKKAIRREAKAINTCIACNQTCLDRIFAHSAGEQKTISCLVNPWAANETELPQIQPTSCPQKLAVVGAGPAGLVTAVTLAEGGHKVTIYDSNSKIGGQFLMAEQVPGKEDYRETLRYFSTRIQDLKIELHLNSRPTVQMLSGYEHVFVATGTQPRVLSLPGSNKNVLSYHDVFHDSERVGRRVAIVGAGAVAFDVAAFLLKKEKREPDEIQNFFDTWKIDFPSERPSRINGADGEKWAPCREIVMLQRRPGIVGGFLGRTTGWIKKDILVRHDVRFLSDVVPLSFEANGLHLRQGNSEQVIEVDTVVVCIGAEPRIELSETLKVAGISHTVVGGASLATSSGDAEFAIQSGVQAALRYQTTMEQR